MYKGGQVALADGTISSTDDDAISIDRADDVIVQNCCVNAKDIGVWFAKSKGKIVESFITGCERGVVANEGSQVEAIGNSLDRNGTALVVIVSPLTVEKKFDGRQFSCKRRGNLGQRFADHASRKHDPAVPQRF